MGIERNPESPSTTPVGPARSQASGTSPRKRVWCCIVRKRAEYPGHVWAYDFLTDRTEDGRRLKVLGVPDEYTRECLALAVGRNFLSQDVLKVLEELVTRHGRPEHMRSDNGPEFIAPGISWHLLPPPSKPTG
ncbi:MAG: DDE-type integrase/transposase/recombinase [Thermoanaerobaculia bacterium]|nr:DDE-type integrase/transposase/recombinase [Thermoanaerobaculia bacterium]